MLLVATVTRIRTGPVLIAANLAGVTHDHFPAYQIAKRRTATIRMRVPTYPSAVRKSFAGRSGAMSSSA